MVPGSSPEGEFHGRPLSVLYTIQYEHNAAGVCELTKRYAAYSSIVDEDVQW